MANQFSKLITAGNKKGFGWVAKSFFYVRSPAGNRVANGVLSTPHNANHKMCGEIFQVSLKYCMVIQVLSGERSLIVSDDSQGRG
ncbi:hypothetical protein HA51_16685 [Pantoea rwandensis]|uniref:Uncharacterized protein n=1 Tax=Pantoea rwandensis TaxID=1076550 RepID=A0A1X1CUQ6_9GAMM|nr:hypothetical protein HA51_16685 [Pantoea rwandensis]